MRGVQSLYANDLKLIKNLEESLGVKVTTREGWIKVEGEPAQVVESRSRVFTQLERRGSRRRYPAARVQLRPQFRERSARGQSERSGRDQDHDLVPQAADRRAHARPAQLCRGDSETRHRLRNRSGRHGKTYLAVAMAVAALKKEQVDRIILTRPAVEAGEALGFLPGDLQQKITPYLRPLYDALRDMLEPEEIERYVARADDRDRAARLHARPHPEQRLRHSG